MAARRPALVLGLLALLAVLGGTAALLVSRAGASRARGELMALMSADLRAESTAIDAEPMPPESANAALHYEAAFAKLKVEGWHLAKKLDREWTEVPPDLAKWVGDNAAALSDAEAGAALEDCRFPFPPGTPAPGLRAHPYGPPAQCEGLPHLASLFACRARLHLEAGRTSAAVADALRVPRVVRHILLRSAREPSSEDRTVLRAVSILEQALRRPDMDATAERSVVAGLLDWPQVMEGDAMRRRILALGEEEWAAAFLTGHWTAEGSAGFRRQFGLPEASVFGKATAEDCRLLSLRRERWLADRERAKSGAPPAGPPPTWIGRLGLVRVVYAARVYERIHGRPPARIEDLVPDVLSEVPRDPSGTGPLRVDWPPRLGWDRR